MLRVKRLMFASLVMLFFLPLASALNSNPISAGLYNSVALAGHSVPGSFYCECGCPGCICDPEEMYGNCSYGATARSSQSDVSDSVAPEGTFDPGAGLMILASLFFLWARLRY